MIVAPSGQAAALTGDMARFAFEALGIELTGSNRAPTGMSDASSGLRDHHATLASLSSWRKRSRTMKGIKIIGVGLLAAATLATATPAHAEVQYAELLNGLC